MNLGIGVCIGDVSFTGRSHNANTSIPGGRQTSRNSGKDSTESNNNSGINTDGETKVSVLYKNVQRICINK